MPKKKESAVIPAFVMKEPEWYQVHQNLVDLAFWMDEQGEFSTTDDVLSYFEKPWKWQEQWDKYQRGIEAEKYREESGIPFDPKDPLDVFVWTEGEAEVLLYDYAEDVTEAILEFGLWDGRKPQHVRSLVKQYEDQIRRDFCK